MRREMKQKMLLKKIEKFANADVILHINSPEFNIYFNLSEVAFDGSVIILRGKTKTTKHIRQFMKLKEEFSDTVKE